MTTTPEEFARMLREDPKLLERIQKREGLNEFKDKHYGVKGTDTWK